MQVLTTGRLGLYLRVGGLSPGVIPGLEEWLPVNDDTITLVREEWRVPDALPFGDGKLVPLRAGEMVPWKLA